MSNDLYRALEGGRAEREQHRENSARFATTYVDYLTTGVGTFLIQDPVMFDAGFMGQPMVTSGVVVNTDLESGAILPQVTAGARGWVRNDRDHYIGALIWFAIGGEGEDDLELRHWLAFSGTAYKMLGSLPGVMPNTTLGTRLPPAFNPDNY